MTIVVLQFFGAGDVIYEQTLVRYLAKGSPIIWPVEPHMVEGFNRAYPDISFVDRTKFNIDYERKDDYIEDGIRYLPLRWADQILQVTYRFCMKSKYDMYGLDFMIWKQQATWIRDRKKEEELYLSFGCDKGEYNLVNTFFGTFSQLQVPIKIDNNLPSVEMRTIPGYSLFDWAKIIENATEIHVVNSAILFLFELLTLKAKQPHLYRRHPIEVDFRNVDYLFTKDYVLHM
jgi:hypothetical protein